MEHLKWNANLLHVCETYISRHRFLRHPEKKANRKLRLMCIYFFNLLVTKTDTRFHHIILSSRTIHARDGSDTVFVADYTMHSAKHFEYIARQLSCVFDTSAMLFECVLRPRCFWNDTWDSSFSLLYFDTGDARCMELYSIQLQFGSSSSILYHRGFLVCL